MVLYPQLYSTVNQNQIHLHLHATATPDKIEQYLGSAASAMDQSTSSSMALMPPSSGVAAERVEIGIGTSDGVRGGGAEVVAPYERGAVGGGDTRMDTSGGAAEVGAQSEGLSQRGSQESRDAITTESVWRPY